MHASATITAVLLCIGASPPVDAQEYLGTWQFEDQVSFLSIALKEQSQCVVIAMVKRRNEGNLVPCEYEVSGDTITINWKHEMGAGKPLPSRLFLVAGNRAMRVDGEPAYVLIRSAASPSR